MNDNKLSLAIVEGAWNPELRDAGIDIGELEIDAFLDEGALKEIPLLKMILACRKTWSAITDQLFLKKVYSFFAATPKFTKEEIDSFVVDHWRGENAQRLGATLVLLIDRLDDLEKPAMLAKVFAAFVRKQITYDSFRRIASGIDRASIHDLKNLVSDQKTDGLDLEPFPTGLVPCGFARLQIRSLRVGTATPIVDAVVSPLGKLFRKCVLCDF